MSIYYKIRGKITSNELSCNFLHISCQFPDSSATFIFRFINIMYFIIKNYDERIKIRLNKISSDYHRERIKNTFNKLLLTIIFNYLKFKIAVMNVMTSFIVIDVQSMMHKEM